MQSINHKSSPFTLLVKELITVFFFFYKKWVMLFWCVLYAFLVLFTK